MNDGIRTRQFAFPTFCHIGEYDKRGYRMLHRMLAVSHPLNLWAPVSSELDGDGCKVSQQAFLRNVRKGHIRVFAREDWLTSRSFRDSRPFPGARWVESFDGVLKEILDGDSSLPVQQRRVVVAPEEGGWTWAKKQLEEKPEQVARWNRVARSETAAESIPAGTLQAAFRFAGDDPVKLATAILRDAHNHGEAIRVSGSEVPFLLNAADRRFLDVLRDAAGSEQVARRGRGRAPFTWAAQPPVLDETGAELAEQLLKVLKLLDHSSLAPRSDKDLDKFLDGEGHLELVAWFRRICEQLKRTDAQKLDNAVVTVLRDELSHAELSRPLRDAIRHPVALSVGAVGLLTAVMGSVIAPSDPVALVGLSAAAFPVGSGLLQWAGYVPASFTGPQWPFLYSYGSPARRQQIAHLIDVLSEP